MPVAKPAAATKITIDFSNVEDRRGNPAAHVPPGDYLLRVEDAEIKETQNGANKGAKYINWQLAIVGGLGRGTVYHTSSLLPNSLWSLRNFLADMLGKDIPRKAVAIDLKNYTGKTIGAVLDDDAPFTKVNDKGQSVTTVKSIIKTTFPGDQFIASTGNAAAADDDAAPVDDMASVEESLSSADDVEELQVEDL